MKYPFLLYSVWKHRKENFVIVLAREVEAIELFWRSAALLKISSWSYFTVGIEKSIYNQERREG